MTTLRRATEEYVALRRSLGFHLEAQAGILRRFAKFAAQQKAPVVTTALVRRWVAQKPDVLPATAARSLSVVRLFAVWWKQRDPRTEVPPERLMPGRHLRHAPFLHSADQIAALLAAASRLESKNGVRGLTYSTLFGLIAVAGLRISEAVKLHLQDADLVEGVLTIRPTTFRQPPPRPPSPPPRRGGKVGRAPRRGWRERPLPRFLPPRRGPPRPRGAPPILLRPRLAAGRRPPLAADLHRPRPLPPRPRPAPPRPAPPVRRRDP